METGPSALPPPNALCDGSATCQRVLPVAGSSAAQEPDVIVPPPGIAYGIP
jgi:hypothetical protein